MHGQVHPRADLDAATARRYFPSATGTRFPLQQNASERVSTNLATCPLSRPGRRSAPFRLRSRTNQPRVIDSAPIGYSDPNRRRYRTNEYGPQFLYNQYINDP
mgnify:FL=1